MNLEEKEQQQPQAKKIKDEGNLAINIMEEILQEIGQVEQEAVKVKEAPQITEIEEMQLIIEWKKETIQKEMDEIKAKKFEQIKEIKERKELILKLEQLQAINIEQEMGQAMRRMENVRNEVQQLMHQIEIILSKGKQENPNCTLDNKLQVLRTRLGKTTQEIQLLHEYSEPMLHCLQHYITTDNNVSVLNEAYDLFQKIKESYEIKVAINEVLKRAQQVHLHMRKEMNKIQQEMQQLQEQAKLIKDKAQKLQQQTELDPKEKHHMEPKQLQELPHLQYIKEQIKRINEEIQRMKNQEFEQQYAPLELLQITLIIQNQMQWIQEQAKSLGRQKQRQWDEYYMKIACLTALRSKDPRTPVGACIVHMESHTIVGIGYNSMPYIKGGHNDEIFLWKKHPKTDNNNAQQEYPDLNKKKDASTQTDDDPTKMKSPYVVHAAVNAIANKTRESIKGCTIYTTLHPDEDCAHAIVLAGIKEVIYCMFTKDKDKRMEKKDMENATKFLEANNIVKRKMTLQTDNNKAVSKLRERIEKAKDWHSEPSQEAISWEEFFMGIAILSTKRPGQYDRKQEKAVGACIVSPKNQIMAVGYSGYPEHMEHDKIALEEEQQPYIRHAEYMAIVGGPKVEGCTLYVTTYPCNMCARVIVQAGITKVVYHKDKNDKPMYIGSEKILTTCLEGKTKEEKIRICKFEKGSFVKDLYYTPKVQ